MTLKSRALYPETIDPFIFYGKGTLKLVRVHLVAAAALASKVHYPTDSFGKLRPRASWWISTPTYGQSTDYGCKATQDLRTLKVAPGALHAPLAPRSPQV